MNDQGCTKSELAERLGKTEDYATRVLDGSRVMTLRTLADLVDVLDCYIDIKISNK